MGLPLRRWAGSGFEPDTLELDYLYAAAPKLAVYEPLADGAVKAVNEAEASDQPAGDTQIAAQNSNLVTLAGGKVQVFQIQK